MKTKLIVSLIIELMAGIMSTWPFCASVLPGVDWAVVSRDVRIVNIEQSQSLKGDIFKSLINGRYAIRPEPDKQKTMYYIEYSDHPSYKYMFVYGDEFFGRKWYFNLNRELNLPVVDDLQFVELIKAYSGAHSRYFRLFRSIVDNSLTIKGDNPFFGYIVYSSDDGRYKYMFSQSGLNWYFTPSAFRVQKD